MDKPILHSAQQTSDTSQQKVCLKKQITLLQAVSVIVGIIIGAGIFISPVGILRNVKSTGMSLVMWAVCGVFNTLCALCYAELGTTISASGGEYAYVMKAFGDYPAFVCLWVNCLLICPVGLAASSLIFATYILQPLFPDCEYPDIGIRLIAAIIIMLLVAINTLNVNWATRAQVIITASKLIALAMIVIIGIVWFAKGDANSFTDVFEGSDYNAGSIALSFYSGFWAFGGWSYLNFLTDELIEPHRNLPRAIVISMAIVTVVYLVANVAYFAILTPTAMLQSSAVAVTFADLTIPRGAWIMPVLIALSVSGSINGVALSMSRLFWAGAVKGHFPAIIGMLHFKRLTPSPALIVMLILTLILQCCGDIFFLIEMEGFAFSFILVAVFSGQVYMRVSQPDLPRPIKLPLVVPAFLVLICLSICGLTIYQKPRESLGAICVIAASLPTYLLAVTWKHKPKWIANKLDSITIVLQKLLQVTTTESEEESKHTE